MLSVRLSFRPMHNWQLYVEPHLYGLFWLTAIVAWGVPAIGTTGPVSLLARDNLGHNWDFIDALVFTT